MKSPFTRRQAVAVSCDGPFADQNQDGDEIPCWVVCVIDEDGDPCGKVYQCGSLAGARNLAARMAEDRKLELVDDSMSA